MFREVNLRRLRHCANDVLRLPIRSPNASFTDSVSMEMWPIAVKAMRMARERWLISKI
jgi:hypothetical protein